MPAEGAQERGGQVLPGQVQGGERQRQEQEVQEKEEKGRIVNFFSVSSTYLFPCCSKPNVYVYTVPRRIVFGNLE